MNIGTIVILNRQIDHIPMGAQATVYGIYPSHSPSIFDPSYRSNGMLKISTYGYEGNSGRSTHYNTYVHRDNVSIKFD